MFYVGNLDKNYCRGPDAMSQIGSPTGGPTVRYSYFLYSIMVALTQTSDSNGDGFVQVAKEYIDTNSFVIDTRSGVPSNRMLKS
jgi:hypothetical protein